jgi:hypothetical protein
MQRPSGRRCNSHADGAAGAQHQSANDDHNDRKQKEEMLSVKHPKTQVCR